LKKNKMRLIEELKNSPTDWRFYARDGDRLLIASVLWR